MQRDLQSERETALSGKAVDARVDGIPGNFILQRGVHCYAIAARRIRKA